MYESKPTRECDLLHVPVHVVQSCGSSRGSRGGLRFIKNNHVDSFIERFEVSHGPALFDPHPGRGVVSLSLTFHSHCLVLVKPRKPSKVTDKLLIGI